MRVLETLDSSRFTLSAFSGVTKFMLSLHANSSFHGDLIPSMLTPGEHSEHSNGPSPNIMYDDKTGLAVVVDYDSVQTTHDLIVMESDNHMDTFVRQLQRQLQRQPMFLFLHEFMMRQLESCNRLVKNFIRVGIEALVLMDLYASDASESLSDSDDAIKNAKTANTKEGNKYTRFRVLLEHNETPSIIHNISSCA